jgi:hypothetical protein
MQRSVKPNKWTFKFHKCPDCDKRHLSPEDHREMRKHFDYCAHCGEICPEMFMLEDHVWRQTGLDFSDGVLHIRCVEKLIGRRVSFNDLVQGAGMNKAILYFAENK